MKKIITLIIALGAVLITTKIHAQGPCTFGPRYPGISVANCQTTSSSASASLSSYEEEDVVEEQAYTDPDTDIYISYECESLANGGEGAIEANIDTGSLEDYAYGPSGTMVSQSNVPGNTGDSGFIDLDAATQDGAYAYIIANW